MRTYPSPSSSKEANRSLLSVRRELRSAVHEWRKTNHRINHHRRNESQAHRSVDWCRDIAPELLGFASLFAVGTAILVLCGLIALGVVACVRLLA